MKASPAILDYKDSYLCIRDSDTFIDEPKRITRWWPIMRVSRDEYAEHIGKEAFDARDGIFSVQAGSGAWSGWMTFRLPEGGRTKAMFTEVTEIACPKVRKGIETRYRNGSWQKLLKTGWEVL